MEKIVWIIRPAAGGILVHLDHLLRGLGQDYEIVLVGPEALAGWAAHRRFIPIDIVDGIQLGRDLRAMRQIRSVLRQEQPDLVHMHGLKSVVVGVPACRLERCSPVVFTAHNCLPQAPSWQRLIQSRLLRAIPKVIAVSEAVREELVSIVPQHRVVTVRNGVDCQKFAGFSRAEARGAAGIGSKHIAIGVVSRLIPEKGTATLIEAVSLLKNVNSRIRLVIVGDGPARSKLEGYRDALQLKDTVRFLGAREDVPFLMAGWDIYALPSFSEGFSVSVLEAMASSLPVVVTDLPSMREMVSHGKSGFLVRAKDAPGLAAALLHMIKDMPKTRAMGKYNCERVRNLFGVERMVDRTRSIYSELC